MPTYPFNSKCSHLGCKNAKSALNSYCVEHGGLNHIARQSDRAYQSKAWTQIRQAQITKQPLCQACLIDGHITQGTQVDHVFPWRQFGEYAFRLNIFQTLCIEHHSHKTQQERKGNFIHYGDGQKTYSFSDFNRVVRGEPEPRET